MTAAMTITVVLAGFAVAFGLAALHELEVTRFPWGTRLSWRRWRFEVFREDGPDDPLPARCTREVGHSGPCNGWPCRTAQERLATRFSSLVAEQNGWPDDRGSRVTLGEQQYRATVTRTCGALHGDTGAVCSLEPGHRQNHWGHAGKHLDVQWPHPVSPFVAVVPHHSPGDSAA